MKSDLSDFEIFLSDDWDGEGALAISAQTLKVARELVNAVRGEVDLPDASPSVAGALGLVWKVNDNYLYVSIRNEKTAKFYRRKHNKPSDGRLIEAYSADDLVKELTSRVLSTNVKQVFDSKRADAAQTFIVNYPLDTKSPEAILPGGPGEWASKSTTAFRHLKVA